MTKHVARMIALAAAVSLASVAIAQDGPDLDAVASAYARAVDDNDASALAQLYAEDAVVHSPDAGRVEGRAAIEGLFAAIFAEAAPGDMRITPDEEHRLGDAVLATGSFEMAATGPAGQPATMSGAYFNLYREIDGDWLIVRQIWNETSSAIVGR